MVTKSVGRDFGMNVTVCLTLVIGVTRLLLQSSVCCGIAEL